VTVWLDAQLPPALAPWLTQAFSIEANAVRDLGLHESTDEIIFTAAKKAAANWDCIWMTD
jgi:predicted nuclease of predicted toxin-antitoxin system